MKRDPDLIRKILQYLEEAPSVRRVDKVQVEGYSEEQIEYTLKLMRDANLIDAAERTHVGRCNPIIDSIQLTSPGHDFLEAIRDDSVWSKRKEKIAKLGVDVFLETIKTLGAAAALGLLR